MNETQNVLNLNCCWSSSNFLHTLRGIAADTWLAWLNNEHFGRLKPLTYKGFEWLKARTSMKCSLKKLARLTKSATTPTYNFRLIAHLVKSENMNSS